MSDSKHYHNLLERVNLAMKDYRLPPEIKGVNYDDTGAVITVVLYFIMKEPKISKKKIKCYLLLLNKICQYKGKGDIFRWELDFKFIDELIAFMKEKKLIRMNGNSKYQLVISESPDFDYVKEKVFPLISRNILAWLDSILKHCGKMTAVKMTEPELVKQLKLIIDGHAQEQEQENKNENEADDIAKIASEWQRLIDLHEREANEADIRD